MSAIHAGDAIVEHIRANEIRQGDLARLIGCSEKHLSEVVNGHVRLSAHFAVLIEAHTGLSARELLRIQADHDLDKAITRLAAIR